MSSSALGSPTIFIDSNPEAQGGRLYSLYSAVRNSLKTSITGKVSERNVRPLQPGQLRLVWCTEDGKEGMKDYPLLQHDAVRDRYDELLQLRHAPDPSVRAVFRRVYIEGFSGQNPYFGSNSFVTAEEEYERERAREAERKKTSTAGVAVAPPVSVGGEGNDIEAIIRKDEEAERRAKKEQFRKLEVV